MTSALKPIVVYGKGGPNPPKVAMLVAELGLPHQIEPISFPDLKKPEFLAINPNGRMPAIQDPNFGTDGITIWETGAIIEYLIERYDTEHKLSFPAGTAEAYHAKQWLFFQASGQGPYFGQVAFFKKFHHEQLPSAIERFVKEVNRVTGVLDGWLAKQDKEGKGGADGPWLVGGRLSFADLSFVPWASITTMIATKEEFDPDQYPHYQAWLGRMMARPIVKTVMDEAFKGH